MARVLKGYGGFPRTKGSKSKVSTHPVFKLTCKKCNHSQIKAYKNRSKKVRQV